MEIPNEIKTICKKVVENLSLSQKDRESLSIKRGFSDDVIDKMMFKSCDETYLEMYKDRFEFLENEDIRYKLKSGKIIIPFFNDYGEVEFFRPHHDFIKGLGSQIYVPYAFDRLMFNKPETLVITEGEFKAVASCVMGIPAISVPGISSFVGTKFGELVSVLKKIDAKNIVICFDKEIKDDPKLEKYKPDFTKRYDTEYYAIVTGLKLIKELAMVDRIKIAELDKSWMVDGKIDIDGFLASGRNHKLYRDKIDEALTPKKFQFSLKMPKAHASFLNRRIDAEFYCGPIVRSFKSYFYRKGDDLVPLTNFVMKISNNLQTDEEVVRVCKLVSDYGESPYFKLKAEHMTGKSAFMKQCYSLGDFQYMGDDNQIRHLWDYVFKHQKGREVFELDHYGYIEEVDSWVFANGSYDNKTGAFTPIDEEGILWINDIGYRLPEQGTTGLRPPSVPAPVSQLSISYKELEINLMEALLPDEELRRTNQHFFARFILGWIFAIPFMPDLIKGPARDGFPLLFIYGRASSGKTTLANWVNSFFGISGSKGIQVSSTKVGIQNACARYSMLPLWLDEYRNNERTADKNDLFRSVYDRASAIKGSKIQGKVREYPLRSTLMISGEEYPNDAALNTRCVTVPLFYKRVNVSKAFVWIETHKEQFVELLSDLFTRRSEIYPNIVNNIRRFNELFTSNKITNRIGKNFAIVSGAADALLGQNNDYDNFIVQWVKDYEAARNDESSVSVFFQDLTTGLINRTFDCTFAKIMEKHNNEGYLLINLKAAYAIWENFCKRNRSETPMKFDVIEKWISTQDWCLSKTRARIGDVQMRAHRIDLSFSPMSTQVRGFADVVKARQKRDDGHLDLVKEDMFEGE